MGRCHNCKSILYESISIHPELGYSLAKREKKLHMDLSDAPTSIRERWHTLINRTTRCNAVPLVTRDVSWQGMRSEVCLSLCWGQICTADSPRDARLLVLVRGRVLELFCLVPLSPHGPLRSSLCCPTAEAFYRPRPREHQLRGLPLGSRPISADLHPGCYARTCWVNTHTCAHTDTHTCAKSTFTNDSCTPLRVRYWSPS